MNTREFPFHLLLISFCILSIFTVCKYVQIDRNYKTLQRAHYICDSTVIAKDSIISAKDSIIGNYVNIKEQIKVLLMGVPDSANIYNQIIAESGNCKSSTFIRTKNLFGFTNSRGIMSFKHWKDSFYYFMTKFYCDKKHNESYCNFVRRKKFGIDGYVDYCIN